MRHALAFLAAVAAATTLVAGAAAGAAAPGAVAVSSHHGGDVFDCMPAAAGTNPATNTCVIVQSSTSASNVAVCRMRDTGTPVTQSCSITQTNQAGANRAVVDLVARVGGSSAQDVRQIVSVQQTSGSGANRLHSRQRIDESISHGGPLQTQEGHQTLDADQTSTSGSNSSNVAQHQLLRAKAFAHSGLVQRQNAADLGPNLDADVTQNAASGRNFSLLKQKARYNAFAKSKAGPVEQRQGSAAGGLRGNIDQSSSNPSRSVNFQDEKLNARAQTRGTITQVQFGPAECCTEQLGNANNVFVIKQRSKLASDGGSQTSRISGSCITSGMCSVDQLQRTDDDFERNSESCTASFPSTCAVFIGIVCVPEEGCFPTEDEEGPSVVERDVRTKGGASRRRPTRG